MGTSCANNAEMDVSSSKQTSAAAKLVFVFMVVSAMFDRFKPEHKSEHLFGIAQRRCNQKTRGSSAFLGVAGRHGGALTLLDNQRTGPRVPLRSVE